MKRSIIFTVMLALFFGARAFAALGNSESEVEELFGKPVNQGFPNQKGITTNVYEKGDYVILVQFLDHLSLAESYTRTDQTELTQREIDLFLEGSGNEQPWTKNPTKQEWERADHKARAWCTTVRGRPTLLVQAE